MVTVAWNPVGFHLVEVLANGRDFNAKYHRDNILTERIRFRPEAGERHVVIRADNSRPHTAQQCRTFCAENGVRPAIHALCWPDLAPSDFFLFGYVEHRLQGLIFPSGEELLAGIRAVLGRIPLETLAQVFDHWLQRLEWVSQNNRDYDP
jgi:hypothetical protein